MTFEEALSYSQQYARRAKALTKLPADKLKELDASLLSAAGSERLFGQLSKDELIAEILAMEFPLIVEADEVRATQARVKNP